MNTDSIYLKNRMLAYFYSPRLSNNINIAVHKHNLGKQVIIAMSFDVCGGRFWK